MEISILQYFVLFGQLVVGIFLGLYLLMGYARIWVDMGGYRSHALSIGWIVGYILSSLYDVVGRCHSLVVIIESDFFTFWGTIWTIGEIDCLPFLLNVIIVIVGCIIYFVLRWLLNLTSTTLGFFFLLRRLKVMINLVLVEDGK